MKPSPPKDARRESAPVVTTWKQKVLLVAFGIALFFLGTVFHGLIGPDGAMTQMRELKAGNNFLSQSPAIAHFGIGNAERVDVMVIWPGGVRTMLFDVAAGEALILPELPVSFDDPSINFYPYFLRVNKALQEHVLNGVITEKEAARIRSSALKAYVRDHFGGGTQ